MQKIGLDIHGVIDSNPEFFSALSKDLVSMGWEVHIITGPTITKATPELEKYKITYTHFFSIEDYHIARHTPMTYDEKGNPWMDKETWDKTKGEYCHREGVNLHLDDTEKYKQYFKTSFATYRKQNETT